MTADATQMLIHPDISKIAESGKSRGGSAAKASSVLGTMLLYLSSWLPLREVVANKANSPLRLHIWRIVSHRELLAVLVLGLASAVHMGHFKTPYLLEK